MENTKTDASKYSQKPGYYWIKAFKDSVWELSEYKDGKWKFTNGSRMSQPFEIDETPIKRQSQPSTLDKGEVSEDVTAQTLNKWLSESKFSEDDYKRLSNKYGVSLPPWFRQEAAKVYIGEYKSSQSLSEQPKIETK